MRKKKAKKPKTVSKPEPVTPVVGKWPQFLAPSYAASEHPMLDGM